MSRKLGLPYSRRGRRPRRPKNPSCLTAVGDGTPTSRKKRKKQDVAPTSRKPELPYSRRGRRPRRPEKNRKKMTVPRPPEKPICLTAVGNGASTSRKKPQKNKTPPRRPEKKTRYPIFRIPCFYSLKILT